MSKTYWQVAAGSIGRNYADLFLKFGMAFVGGENQVKTMAQGINWRYPLVEERCLQSYCCWGGGRKR